VDDYMPVIDKMDEEIEWMEDTVLEKPNPKILERILNLKHSLMAMRRIISPQREIMNRLSRDDFPQIDRQSRIYFRDIYDHLVRMQDLTESIRDLVSGVLDTYLSVVNNRMNDIMKTLTVITTLFMPISFIASFFGMNFFTPVTPLDLWTGLPAYIAVLVFITLTPTFMYLWIRRRGWMA
jgi:magnesium transporter